MKAFFLLPLVFLLALFSPGQTDVPSLNKWRDGWWILSSYADGIFLNKQVGAHTTPPAYDAVLLYISGDTAIAFGTLIENKKLSLSHESDTISEDSAFAPRFFRSNLSKKSLTVYWSENHKLRHSAYRRLTQRELVLTNGLLAPGARFVFHTNWHRYLVRYLLAGKYQSLENARTVLSLNADETMSGFGKWNRHEVDDFFGTTHWTGKLDRIRFEDTTCTVSDYRLNNSDKGCYRDYNWSFSGDTLVLREFTGYDIELYRPGTKRLRFLKLKK